MLVMVCNDVSVYMHACVLVCDGVFVCFFICLCSCFHVNCVSFSVSASERLFRIA